MGEYYGLAVVAGVALLLLNGQCDANCKGMDGRPGQAGALGRDGLPGAKGQKGEPAVMDNAQPDADTLLMLKGERGSRGLQGVMGPKGYRGDLGARGPSGLPGPPGPEGKRIGQDVGPSQQSKSAFSVIRDITDYPPLGQVVTYQRYAVNSPGDFNKDTGYFTCRTPGVYYFVFHSMAKVSMCLNIASEALIGKIGFCNINRNYDQVLSGGVVLKLEARQKVWLESFLEQKQPNFDTGDTRPKEIIFNGFLLFSS